MVNIYILKFDLEFFLKIFYLFFYSIYIYNISNKILDNIEILELNSVKQKSKQKKKKKSDF